MSSFRKVLPAALAVMLLAACGSSSGSGSGDVDSRFEVVDGEPVDGAVDVSIYVDTSSIELFADEGRVVITSLVLPPTTDGVVDRAASVTASGGATLERAEVSPFRS